MFDENINGRRTTLIAGLILLIVLAAVAAMSAGLGAGTETTGASGAISLRTHTAAPQRLVPQAHDRVMERLLGSLGPIEEPMAACLGDGALIAYDLGVAPAAAFEVLDQLLDATAPKLHEWLRGVLAEFQMASGLEPEIDLLPHLDHGMAVGLLPPEGDLAGWPFPRKVVIMRVLDEVAVSRFLEEWITWEAGAVAPMTQGVLGASIYSEKVAGFDLVGLQLDGLLPAQLPLPSPSYVVAGDYLIVSPVRSAVVETLSRLEEGCLPPPAGTTDETVVEEVWLNFPEWPRAWQRAEPLVGSILARLGVESPATLQACGSLFQLLGGFQPAHGTTSLTPEGGFVFRIEMTPLR